MLVFDFWRCLTGLRLHHDLDEAHFAYYFADYLRGDDVSPSGALDLEVELECDGPTGFVGGLRCRTVEKRVWLTRRGTRELYERFHDLPSPLPTPIPPFALEPLRTQFQLFHSAAIADPSGSRAYLLTGPTRGGKSTGLLSMLTAGWRFMSDDVVPVDQDRIAFRYTRPINVRERSLGVFPDLTAAIRSAGVVADTVTGTTFMVRPADLGLLLGPVSAPIAGRAQLLLGPHFEATATARGDVRVRWDPVLHREELVQFLTRVWSG